MSQSERRRLVVLSEVASGDLSVSAAGRCLGLCERQARRVWKRYREWGDAGMDNALRRLKHIQVREHLDGRIELWSKDRELNCEELPQRPAKPPPPTPPPLAERVAEQTGSAKPAANHPWRQAAKHATLISVYHRTLLSRLRHHADEGLTLMEAADSLSALFRVNWDTLAINFHPV